MILPTEYINMCSIVIPKHSALAQSKLSYFSALGWAEEMSRGKGAGPMLGDRINRLELELKSCRQDVQKILKAIDPVGEGEGLEDITKRNSAIALQLWSEAKEDLEQLVERSKAGMDWVISKMQRKCKNLSQQFRPGPTKQSSWQLWTCV